MLNLKKNKGITLIALIITIIILLILAGITIAQLTQTGLFGKAQEATIKNKKASAEENLNLEIMRVQMEKKGSTNLDDIFIDFSSNNNEKINVTEAKFAPISSKEDSVADEIPTGQKTTLIKLTVAGYEEFEFTLGESLEIEDIAYNGEEVEKFSITYNATTGSGTMSSTTGIISGRKVTLPESSFTAPSGYVFSGWSTSNTEDAEYKAGDKITITGNTELFAVWIKDVWVIEYYANNGTDDKNHVEVDKGQNTTLLGNTAFTKADSILASWNTEPDGSGTPYTVGASLTPTGNVKLYAQWTPDNVLPAGTYTPGQEVTFKGEKFFVIKDDGDSVRLLAKYCVKSDGSEQYDKDATYSTYGRSFSNTNYWNGKSGVSYPCDLQTSDRLGWIPSTDTTSNNTILCAQAYGTSKGVTGRLMTYEEANAIQTGSDKTMKNILWGKWTDGTQPTQGYLYWWLEAAGSEDCVLDVYGSNSRIDNDHYYLPNSGVRPVLVVSKS